MQNVYNFYTRPRTGGNALMPTTNSIFLAVVDGVEHDDYK